MSTATPKFKIWYFCHLTARRPTQTIELCNGNGSRLTQGGYPSVVTNVFDPTDKRICGSSPFGPMNWSRISQSRLDGLKFWEFIFRIEFEIISDCFEFNKRTFNSSQLILCLKLISGFDYTASPCFEMILECCTGICFNGKLTFSSDCRDPKLIFSLLLVFGARAKYLLSFLVSKMNNLKVQVQHGLVIGRTVSEINHLIGWSSAYASWNSGPILMNSSLFLLFWSFWIN